MGPSCQAIQPPSCPSHHLTPVTTISQTQGHQSPPTPATKLAQAYPKQSHSCHHVISVTMFSQPTSVPSLVLVLSNPCQHLTVAIRSASRDSCPAKPRNSQEIWRCLSELRCTVLHDGTSSWISPKFRGTTLSVSLRDTPRRCCLLLWLPLELIDNIQSSEHESR